MVAAEAQIMGKRDFTREIFYLNSCLGVGWSADIEYLL
jgi:hypothetical protein